MRNNGPAARLGSHGPFGLPFNTVFREEKAMAREWENREGSRRYEERGDERRFGAGRDWSDRAEDEARSWFGDEDAERRRMMDEREDRRHFGGGGYDRQDRHYGGTMRPFAGRDPYRGSERASPGERDMYGYPRRQSDDRWRYRTSGGQGWDEERGFLDRAGDEVASWFGDENAARRREMDARYRGRGPKNYTRSDERIAEDINDRLSDDGYVDASGIEVSVSGGEITLNGTVTERFAKRRAEDIAESISGVRHVQNNLRVATPADTGAETARTGSRSTPEAGSSATFRH